MTLGRFQRSRRIVQARLTPYRAILGDGNGNVKAGDGMYWVRPYDAANAQNNATPGTPYRVRAGSALIVPREGRLVWIYYGPDRRLTVMAYDHDDLIQAGIDPLTVQPNDPYRQWIRLKNIQNFRALPIGTGNTPSMKASVRQLFYLTATGDLVRWNGTNADTHIDLTDYVPEEGFQCYVVLWLRTYNPNGLDPIQVTTSDHIDSIDAVLSFDELQQCADAADPDAIPIQAFRLANAQTALKLDNSVDVDLRQFINMPQVYGFPNTVDRGYRIHEGFSVVAPSAITMEDGGVVIVQDNALLLILSADDEEGGGGSVTWDDQAANKIFAGPTTGAPAPPAFRSMVSEDIGQIVEFGNLTTDMREISANAPTVLDDGPDGKLWQRNSTGFESWWILNHHDAFGTPIWLRIGRVVTVLTSTNFLSVTNGSNGQSTITPVSGAAGLVVATPGAATGPVELQALTNGHLPIVSIAKGGTGESTKAPAYDALSPTTTQGDIEYRNATTNTRLPIGTANQQLRTNAGATAPEWFTPTSAGAFTVNWQRFTTPGNDTWTKPANAKFMRVIVVGAGGGGGSGRQGLINTSKSGGGGGAAGYAIETWFDAGELPSASYTLRVGAGGTGGATSSGSGNNGTAGGDSYFGNTAEATALVTAKGGLGGAAGTSAATVNGGVGGTTWGKQTQTFGADGGGGVAAGTAPEGGVSALGPGAGGGASGRNAANTNGVAGAGGRGNGSRFGSLTGGGGAVNTGASGSGGANGLTDGTGPLTFGAGGGGGDFNVSTASNGGAGGTPSGGGGGGAASQASTSGAGGDGATGVVIVVTYCFG